MRKGTVTDQKFKGVLHVQGIRLTDAEFALLDNNYSYRSNMTNYKQFCDDLDNIFTDKNLEKDPLNKPQKFNAPSILDPKDVLNNAEE